MQKTSLFLAAAGMVLAGNVAKAQTADAAPIADPPKNEARMPSSPDQATSPENVGRPDAVSTMQPPLPPPDVSESGGVGGPRGPRHGPQGIAPPPPPPPSKAAEFAIDNGLFKFRVKCAEDEPMRACADIASRLLGQATGAVPR